MSLRPILRWNGNSFFYLSFRQSDKGATRNPTPCSRKLANECCWKSSTWCKVWDASFIGMTETLRECHSDGRRNPSSCSRNDCQECSWKSSVWCSGWEPLLSAWHTTRLVIPKERQRSDEESHIKLTNLANECSWKSSAWCSVWDASFIGMTNLCVGF